MKTKSKKEIIRYGDSVRTALNAYVGSRSDGDNGLLSGFSRRVNASEKPWFLVDGPQDSGKSSFLSGSGAPFEFVAQRDGQAGLRFFFTEDAVYIDPPSGLVFASNDVWGAFCRCLARHKFLRRRAVDGLIIVVDIRELLSMDAVSIDRVAADLRARTDAMSSFTGYDAPVYIVFNKIDLLDGFTELLGDKGIAGRLPFLGAVLSGRDAKAADARTTPVTAFVGRFREICAELSDICARRVISAGERGYYDKTGRLYRFLTRFTLAEAPVAAFLAEFFRARGNGNARFCGFFFTSSGTGAPAAVALSRKVVGEVIPKTPYRAKETSEGTLPYYLRKVASYTLTGMLWAALVSLFVVGGLRDAARIRGLQAELTAIFEGEAAAANQFAALEKMRLTHEYLRGKLRRPWRLIFGTDAVCAAVRRAYTAASERLIALPAARFMEASVNRRITESRADELSASERAALYGELKAYLLLTDGNIVKGVNADSVANLIAPAFKDLSGAEADVVAANIRMTVKLALDGSYKNVPANAKTVEAARDKLAAAPQAAVVYASIMDKLAAARRPLPMSRITGGGGMLKHGRDVSGLYTRDGWENAVFPEFIKASKEPLKADWVTGPPTAVSSEDKLLSELTSLYTDDLTRRWLDFIRNTYVNVQPSLPLLARDLELFAAHDCELGRMLAAVCSLAVQQPADLSLPSEKSAASVKGRVTGAVNKLRGAAATIGSDLRDPFTEARASFAHVETFLKGGAFDAYQGGLGKLAAKIRECGDRNTYVAFITGGADDPLKESRLALDRGYASMPAPVSASLKRVLESPLDVAATALTKAVIEEIEESWKAEVVNPYVNKSINRYPLDKKGNDASWSDFEEFFKPQSGILWKYCDKNLSGVVERTSRGWESVGRSVQLPLSVNDDVIRCLNGAERIANDFFKKDGAPKRHEIVFSPIKSSSGEVVLLSGDKVFDFKNGMPVTIGRQQGAETDEAVILRLTTADKAQEETRFTGEWALSRLFEAGKVDKLGNDKYRVNWRLNVRGIYTANITATVQSNTAALFDRGVIEGFVVPKQVFRGN